MNRARRAPRHNFFTGLKWDQLLHWRRLRCGAPACVSLNGAPKYRFPKVDFEVAIDGGSFGTMSEIGDMSPATRARFVASYGVPISDDDHFFEDAAARAWRPQAHAHRARRVLLEMGRAHVAWIGPQDMMCEPFMLEATGLDVAEHQRRTVANYVELCRLAPDVPWLPVVQGWTVEDYVRCVELYRAAGVDLRESEWVGVGSICRRQGTAEGVAIIVAMLRLGLRVHAFGFKADGLRRLRAELAADEWARLRADSAAWSKHAQRGRIKLPACTHRGPCSNCVAYANVRRLELATALALAA